MQTINRPDLTFPANVAKYVTEAYSDAACILEYGSGGSTVLASEMAGKKIYSVESDQNWAEMISKYAENSELTRSIPILHYADVGPTGSWGHPTGPESWKKFHN